MQEYINHKISEDIDKCVKRWGIEATEDKIYSAYAGCPHLRDQYLNIFYKIFPFLKQ